MVGAPWRSRLLADRWQVNSAHPEYQAIRDSPTLKQRYLALLEGILRAGSDHRRMGSTALMMCHVADGRLDSLVTRLVDRLAHEAGLLPQAVGCLE